MSPANVQSCQHISWKGCITQNLFIFAIQKILYSQNQIDGGTERIASTQIHFLIPGIANDPKPHSIRILPLTDECSVQIHEAAPKRRCDIERTRMARTSW